MLISPALASTARSHFLQHGWAVLPKVIDLATCDALRKGMSDAVRSRREHFLPLPKPSEVFRQSVKEEDPLYSAMRRKYLAAMERRKRRKERRRALIRKRKGLDTAASFDAEDIEAMSRRIAAKLVAADPSQSNVNNDPQRLSAINKFKCNAWMTDEGVKKLVFGPMGKLLGEIAGQVGGVEAHPILIADRPLVKPMFWRQSHFLYDAPSMGIDGDLVVNRGGEQRLLACSMTVILDPCSRLSGDVIALKESHRTIWKARLDSSRLVTGYAPVDSHLPLWLTHFDDLSAYGEAVRIPGVDEIGSVIVTHPYLMYSTGPNLSFEEHVTGQFLVASSKESKPSVHEPSWISSWRTSSMRIDFTDPVIFPRLY